MHKRLYVQCDLDFTLTARSPLLVQGAQDQSNAATFYKARDPADGRSKYCIPASTLRGIWRSAAEGILRTFDEPVSHDRSLACDPFAKADAYNPSCSDLLHEHKIANSPAAYVHECPACRLFGSTAHASLLVVQDCWSIGAPAVEPQTSTSIDRFTGGVKKGALFGYAPLAAGASFSGHVTLHNPDFWQLGLLFLVTREMSAGRVRLGSGTRKGLGHVAVTWQHATFRYSDRFYVDALNRLAAADGVLAPAQALAVDADRVAYPDAERWLLPGLQPQPAQGWADALWRIYAVTDDALTDLQRACVDDCLAPKLRKGPSGFAHAMPTPGEVPHG